MSLVTNLNGTFSLSELQRLKWPVAWSGTVPPSEQESEESALHELADDAIGRLREAYGYLELADGKELEITITNGEIGDIVEV